MSVEGRKFVDEMSPFAGTTFWVHYRLGDIANRPNGYRIFIADSSLAKLCRTSVKSVQRARAEIIEGGFMSTSSRSTAPGRPREYTFLFTGWTVDKLTSVAPTVDKLTGERWTNPKVTPIYRTIIEPCETTSDLERHKVINDRIRKSGGREL